MRRILITGMSGTGKSTVIGALAAHGFKAVDADRDEYSKWVAVSGDADAEALLVAERWDWVWREDRIAALLASEDAAVLFLGGCAENMRLFLPRFDHIILLSAPKDVVIERLRTRATSSYGIHPDEIERVRTLLEPARVLDLIETVEPLLRRVADHEIDTNAPLDAVVACVLKVAGLSD